MPELLSLLFATAELISRAPDSVAVTVYRNDLALISETRQVTLPKGSVDLVFEGVADTLVAQSVHLSGVEHKQQVYDFNPLTPDNLLRSSVGKTVELVRTDSEGREERLKARIVSAQGHVLYRLQHSNQNKSLKRRKGFEYLYCSDLPDRLIFDRLPEGLSAKPRLSARINSPKAGPVKLVLSYLATGYSWSADYRIDYLGKNQRNVDREAESTKAGLIAWLTLRNQSLSSFEKARLNVVAGDLNLKGFEQMRPYARPPLTAKNRQQKCWPTLLGRKATYRYHDPFARGIDRAKRDEVSEAKSYAAVAMAPPPLPMQVDLAVQEALGSYHLYHMPRPVSLKAQQTKQIAFLYLPNVTLQPKLTYEQNLQIEDGDIDFPKRILHLDNRKENNLGYPMPRGTVRLFSQDFDGVDRYIAAQDIEDLPVNSDADLEIGQDPKILITAVLARKDSNRKTVDYHWTIGIDNNGPTTRLLRFVRPMRTGKIIKSSHPVNKEGNYYTWSLSLPAGEMLELRYVVREGPPPPKPHF